MSEQEPGIRTSASQPVRRAFLWVPVVFNLTAMAVGLLVAPGSDWILTVVLVEVFGVAVSFVAYQTLAKPTNRYDRTAVLLAILTMLVSTFFIGGRMDL